MINYPIDKDSEKRILILFFFLFIFINDNFGQREDLSGISDRHLEFRNSFASVNTSSLNYNIINVIPGPAPWIGDITYDGTNLWVGTGDYLLYKISPQDGTVLDSIDLSIQDINGLSFDGKYLWVADCYTSHEIQKIDPSNKQMVFSFTHPFSPATHGVEYKDGMLWVNMNKWGQGDTTVIFDTLGNVTNIIPNGCSYSHGIAFDGFHFWITANFMNGQSAVMYQVDTTSFVHLDSILVPGGNYPNGLCYDGQYFWIANAWSDSIYQIELDVTSSMWDKNDNEYKIYPNPSQDFVSVLIPSETCEARLEFYSIMGYHIQSYSLPSKKSRIDISKFKSGIYFYELYEENQIQGSGRIIKL